VTDTIEALNTGVHRLRDGTEVRRLPSRHQLNDGNTRRVLGEVERKLARLRAKYDDFIRTGDIRPCGCNVPDCPVFFVSRYAAREMDRLRQDILDTFRRVCPDFRVGVSWD